MRILVQSRMFNKRKDVVFLNQNGVLCEFVVCNVNTEKNPVKRRGWPCFIEKVLDRSQAGPAPSMNIQGPMCLFTESRRCGLLCLALRNNVKSIVARAYLTAPLD